MRAVRTWTGARRSVLTKLQDPALVKCELIGTEQHAEQDNCTLSHPVCSGNSTQQLKKLCFEMNIETIG